jgi:hypothetical protein
MDFCGQPGACGANHIQITCNDPGDCAGGVCCGTFQNQTYTDISCQPSCSGFGNITICTDSNQCGFGTTCQDSQYLGNGYKVCK